MAAVEVKDYREELIATAKAVAAPGKGILAADESTGTIGSRFSAIKLENTKENRQQYRQLLFTSEGIEKYISGVILYEETLNQTTDDGVPFADLLIKKGIIPGIKVDKGVAPIRGTKGETYTTGLDGLGARCAEYYAKGCRFAKWRAVLKIDVKDGCPTQVSIEENTRGLARYAAICQDNGLVPIVEPEILVDGDHSIDVAVSVAVRVLAAQYKALHDANVLLEGTLLKPAMCLPGTTHAERAAASPVHIAHATLTALLRTVPAAVPGINFLSGGQSEEEASVNLSAINALPLKKPWNISFSYGRALQQSCLRAWQGKKENEKAAQEAFLARAKANAEASLGVYKGGAGGSESSESLHVTNYTY